jgi:phosphohistidine phosphatase SixA
MQLILLRHGDAEVSSPDSERCLSAIRQLQVIKMANSYGHKLPPIDLVLTSPLKRALQTTELFIANASLKNSFQVMDLPLPDTNIKTVERQLQLFDNKKNTNGWPSAIIRLLDRLFNR